MNKLDLRLVNIMQYKMPLREGGSLPALALADDGFTYVVKFRGAGQREKALLAELLGGEIARLLGFKVPELVLARLDPAFGQTEGDEEIQDLLKSSQGLNLGLHFLSAAVNFDPAAVSVSTELASAIVWLDAYITNVDRSFRNTNMLMWHRELWLIDHGASFIFHHTWDNWEKHAKGPFPSIKDHVLLPGAEKLEEVDSTFKQILSPESLWRIVNSLPEEWLEAMGEPGTVEIWKQVYLDFLLLRLKHSKTFVNQAQDARKALV
ncbi:HipA family kinase [Cyclobacterium jeungdonense]|uniref:Aminotransferase class I and II n=1 Tax=Cyclobacterium jeungdonense TaxID=708087 RepID=A0ABT8C9W9_9BACT|nr:HipA family kinase [Cyclobacterium jeungdonense]MDN3689315.1 aminotransferase class I and II [Cyclobacterium jeungdonense]